METQAIYGVKPTVSIRESCFLPVAEGWTAPTTDELETMLVMIRWKAGDLMRILGVTDRTVRRWLSGQTEIPFAAWCIMSYQAGYGEIWKGSGRAMIIVGWLACLPDCAITWFGRGLHL